MLIVIDLALLFKLLNTFAEHIRVMAVGSGGVVYLYFRAVLNGDNTRGGNEQLNLNLGNVCKGKLFEPAVS